VNFLFSLLYDTGIALYRLAILMASVARIKARQWITGRKHLFENIHAELTPQEAHVWFHCASLGEFEQGRPLIESFRKKFPSHKIVLTFFSPSGYELRKNYRGADYIFYLPADTRRNAKKFLELVQPQLAIFVKYEFWFHFLSELNRRHIPAVLVSARFRKGQWLFRSLASPLKKQVMALHKIFVQDETSFTILQLHGFSNGAHSGDTRFDRVWEIAQSPKQLPVITHFKAETKLLVAGSTWPRDEQLMAQLIREMNASWRLVVVPHEIGDAHISELKKMFPAALLYSDAEAGRLNGDSPVMIVDRIGFLSSVYQYADLAYIGGGFGTGIHNTLEAAVYGIPVLFGPNYHRFNEAVSLIESGGGKSVTGYAELKSAVAFYQRQENVLYGKRNRDWVKQNTGATEKIMQHLEEIISGNGASPA
jgi:3-deoxy-D-manno-octulosonic-acid transferase